MKPNSSLPAGAGLLETSQGLSAQVNANGSLRRLAYRDVLINLFLGNEMEGGPANIYLRRHGESLEATPLIGPRSPSAVRLDRRGLLLSGEWRGIRYQLTLALAESTPAWFWHGQFENGNAQAETLDLIYLQDLALAHYEVARINEFYVSQYVDHTPLTHPERGWVLASRQNLPMGGINPWCAIGSLGKAVSFATDALQAHGLATRAGLPPEGIVRGLAGARRQHEHSMAGIQDAPFRLDPGERAERGFFGWFEENHPEASSSADLVYVDRVLSLPEARSGSIPRADNAEPLTGSLFSTAPILESLELTETEIAGLFGECLRDEERENGRLLSFFAGDRSHVALKAKELAVLRPHGDILRTGSVLVPDEPSLTTTVWMAGVFHSMVTQGHVCFNRFLSTVHSYLGLFRSHGQRLFVEIEGEWRLLDAPSAFEMRPEAARWYYKHEGGMIRVESQAFTDRHELGLTVDVLSGKPLRCLLSNHIAIDGDDGEIGGPARFGADGRGVVVEANPDSEVGRRFPGGGFRIDPVPGTAIEQVGGDELLFPDGKSRQEPYVCIIATPAASVGFRIKGSLIAGYGDEQADAEGYWTAMRSGLRIHPPAASPLAADAARLAEILPWFAHNALIHFLAPRGLEQYSNGSWGTRDISQGPVEMLLALGRAEPVRDFLLRVFNAQNPDGDWPQWFMFFPRERNIRAGDSHGDIVFWPLLALSQYLIASGDASILDQSVLFHHPEGDERAEREPLRVHVERALALIRARVIPGTRLAAYGHGDWNDSLQPADPSMRERLCSAWTVTLNYQTLATLAEASRRVGMDEKAEAFQAEAERVREDFQRYLVIDGVVAGFAYFHDDGRVDYLLHPRDRSTGLSYSLLPMVHAVINGLFTPEQARLHLDLVERHLHGPDGARLFDRPMTYRGGPQKFFQRVESSPFFGREIGLMYTHAHLRYAEALWRHGDADRFFLALCQANPIGIQQRVAGATSRQANCYYSSSDAAFRDRYQAYEEYDRALKGEIPLDGGWRIYSSGGGIVMSLILRCFLGLRRESSQLVLDPLIPPSLDGLRIEVEMFGRAIEATYRIGTDGFGPAAVQLNGADLPFRRGENPYRTGAAEIPLEAIFDRLVEGVNRLSIQLG